MLFVCFAVNDGVDDSERADLVLDVGPNTAPSIATVEIIPDPARASDELTCTWEGFTDYESDSDQSTVEWDINGVPTGTEITLAEGFVRGDVVTCAVTPFDGQNAGELMTDSGTIDNSAPTIDSVQITPDPAYATDTLTCVTAGFSDADGDADQTWYEWPNSSLSSGNEICVLLDGPLVVTVEWPDDTVSNHEWAVGGPTNWEAVQP